MLLVHTRHEEERIFPEYQAEFKYTSPGKKVMGAFLSERFESPGPQLEAQHVQIDELLEQLRKLTNHYQVPEDACTNHQVIFCKLQEFDNDISNHKYLENNILFPKAINIEKELLQL